MGGKGGGRKVGRGGREGEGAKELAVPHLRCLRRTINPAFDSSNDVHVNICWVGPLGQGIAQLLKVALHLPFRTIERGAAPLG